MAFCVGAQWFSDGYIVTDQSYEWGKFTYLNGIRCKKQRRFKHRTSPCPPPPWEISVQTHRNRVYRQSRRHFNLSPRYLICREGTLEGPQTKEHTALLSRAKDHIKGLILMQTWRRGDREVRMIESLRRRNVRHERKKKMSDSTSGLYLTYSMNLICSIQSGNVKDNSQEGSTGVCQPCRGVGSSN